MLELTLAIALFIPCVLLLVWTAVSVYTFLNAEKITLATVRPIFLPAVLFLGAIAAYCWFFFPGTTSGLLYQVLYPHLPTLGLCLLGGIPVAIGAVQIWGDWRRPIGYTWVGIGLFLAGLIPVFLYYSTEVALYAANPLRELDQPLAADLQRFQFTPYPVARNLLKNSYGDSGGHVDINHVDNTLLQGVNAYVAPVIPDGLVQALRPVPRFEVLYDFETGPEINPVEEAFPYAPGLFFLNDLNRRAYQFRHFTIFDNTHYIENPDRPSELIAVLPEWGWAFNHFRMVPTWQGATLVYPSGQMRHLSPADIQKNPAFRGLPLYPSELVRRRANAQNFGLGTGHLERILNGIGKRPGQVELPSQAELFFLPVAGGESYYAYSLEPRGRGQGFAEAFYVNTHTGEGLRVRFQGQNLQSPAAAAEVVKGIPGYNVGYDVVSPRLTTRQVDGKVQVVLVYAIVPRSRQAVAKTVAVDPQLGRSSGPYAFDTRADLVAWLQGGEVQEKRNAVSLEEIEAELQKALQMIKDLRALNPVGLN
ncbi:MAG: hypothetical protein VKK04_06565 [Synechococcales bacterium]|nr:hypothetical protein [Synechococcales bacterium]